MSRDQSDGEDSVLETEISPFDDGTAETEVNGCLTCGAALGLELLAPIVPGGPESSHLIRDSNTDSDP